MNENARKLENCDELMHRISQPCGQSKADREDHIALLRVQVVKDINTMICASDESIESLRNSEGIDDALGSKARLHYLTVCTKKGLEVLNRGCMELLNVTKRSRTTIDIERKFTVLEKREQVRAEAKRANARSIITGTTKLSLPILHYNTK